MPSINETIAFIRRAHANQVDKGGSPYWLHPVSVMKRLPADATDDERRVALLHDVIEDTETTASDLLAMGYSKAVVDAVVLLSRPEGDSRPTYMEWVCSLAASGNKMAIRASGWPPHLYKAVSDSMSKRLADGVEPEYLSGLEFDLWYAIETSKALSALSARAPQHDDHSDDSSKDHHSPDDGKR